MPALSMLKVEKVATPLTALTVAVPASVPLPGLVPMASVTLVVALVTVFPCASCTVTWTAGLMVAPAVALDGPIGLNATGREGSRSPPEGDRRTETR